MTDISHRVGIALLLMLVGAGLLPRAAAGASPCASARTAKTDIVKVMEDMFTAFRTDNEQGFEKISTPDFYAYDAGMRFTGPTLLDLIKNGHASGKRWEWSVTDPEVHVACNLAWITYVNQGSVEDPAGRQNLVWLESAILDYSNAHWRIRFLHSTRAQKPG